MKFANRFPLVRTMCFCYLVFAGSSSVAGCVKVAAIFSQTGEGASGQLQPIRGIQIAAGEIEKKTPPGGRCLELVWIDDKNTPIGSHLAAQAAVSKGVSAVVGPAHSTNALVAAKVLQAEKIPMITTGATHPAITKIGNYIFRAGFTDSLQGKILAEYVANVQMAKTAVIFRKVNSDYSLGLTEVFQDTFTGLGAEVIRKFDYLRERRDFTALLKPIQSLSPDILFIPGHSESGLIARQAMEAGISAFLLGGDGWGSRAFFEKGGHAILQGGYLTHWTPALDTPESRVFVEKYSGQYALNSGMALSYDAMHLLWDAVLRAESTDPRKIRKALAQTKYFPGVTGNITFDRLGDPVKPAVIMEITRGRARLLKTVSP